MILSEWAHNDFDFDTRIDVLLMSIMTIWFISQRLRRKINKNFFKLNNYVCRIANNQEEINTINQYVEYDRWQNIQKYSKRQQLITIQLPFEGQSIDYLKNLTHSVSSSISIIVIERAKFGSVKFDSKLKSSLLHIFTSVHSDFDFHFPFFLFHRFLSTNKIQL